MHILFIYPEFSWFPRWKGSFHFGIGWLSAVLKQAGHTTSLLHLTKRENEKVFLRLLKQQLPVDLLAFSTTSNDFSYVRQLAGWAKEMVDVPVICGGVHATVAPEEVIADENMDMICVGEGEDALVELCDALARGRDYSSI
ncbi:MAG: cobalamin-dependent protein, partial [bacterium]